MFHRLLICVSILFFVAACGDGGASSNTPKDNTPVQPTPPKKKQLVRQTPRVYDVQLKTGEGDDNPSVVTWTAKVPTGGWTMKTEAVLVEETFGKLAARIYIIIEQPNPEEVVTQAEETLKGEVKDKRKIERLEFSTKVYARGIDDPERASYGVMKAIKYPTDLDNSLN